MNFKSTQVTGQGRGKQIGFPTLNLKIPKNFQLKEGIYATKVIINSNSYAGALHFGPIPTFKETDSSLEVFLIDLDSKNFKISPGQKIAVTILKRLREIRNFSNTQDLINQINEDVNNARGIFNNPIYSGIET